MMGKKKGKPDEREIFSLHLDSIYAEDDDRLAAKLSLVSATGVTPVTMHPGERLQITTVGEKRKRK